MVHALADPPHAVGSLSQFFHSAGQGRPATLLMPSKTWVLYRSDAIGASHAPMLVTLDARSTTILTIELAAERSAATWTAHLQALEAHPCFSLGLASDRATGLLAGSQAACDMALWVADDCHAFRDRCEVRPQLARTASAAMTQEYEAARTFANATSAAHLHTRLAHYATAQRTWEQAMALYDHLARLLHVLRAAFHVCSPHGSLRTVENVRSALRLRFDMLAALDCAAISKTLTPLRKPLDAL